MMARSSQLVSVVAVALIALGFARPAHALESDQFTLPPKQLGDIGPEIDAELKAILLRAMELTNRKIGRLEAERDETTDAEERAEIDGAIAELLDPIRMAEAVKRKWGEKLPVTTFETWIVKHKFNASPAYYEPPFGDTVFADQALWKPLLIGAMSPTIKVHGVYQGADKIGHLIQQGFDYYRRYRNELRHGGTEAEAIKAAVDFGIDMEKTWGGQWWTGVYSNSDLAANYAGMKFYINLGEPVKVGRRTMPAILTTDGGRWAWNPEASDKWFAVYVTEHLDEAMNPFWCDGLMRGGLAKRIKARGAQWVAHHNTTMSRERARLLRLSTWHGEDYGHSGFDDVVTIVTAYFDAVAGERADAGDR